MAKVTDHRALIETWLSQQSQVKPINGDIEVQTIFDRERDRYLLVDLGWDGHRRVYNCVFHRPVGEENSKSLKPLRKENLRHFYPKSLKCLLLLSFKGF